MKVELQRCGDREDPEKFTCGKLKPITDFPRAYVAKGDINYYRVDAKGIPRKRNRCSECQRAYNRRAKERQREREAQAIEEARARGDKVALIPLDPKAPKRSISGVVGRVRKLEV